MSAEQPPITPQHIVDERFSALTAPLAQEGLTGGVEPVNTPEASQPDERTPIGKFVTSDTIEVEDIETFDVLLRSAMTEDRLPTDLSSRTALVRLRSALRSAGDEPDAVQKVLRDHVVIEPAGDQDDSRTVTLYPVDPQ